MKQITPFLALATALAGILAGPANGQTVTNLATTVAVGGGRSSGDNVVIESSIGGMGGTSGASVYQSQHGYVAQMRPALATLLRPALAGGVNLTVFGEDGVNYTVQRSANLLSWVNAGDLRMTNGVARVFLPPSPGTGSSFYRVVGSE